MFPLFSLIIITIVCAEPSPPQEYPYQSYQDAGSRGYESNSDHQSGSRYEKHEEPMRELQNLGLLDAGVAHRLDSDGWQDAVPGTPGLDYPNLSYIPETSFSCADKTPGGYYADVETKCQVFHVCNTGGVKASFLCPSGSIFNQKYFVCDWWYDFECDNALELYSLNDKLNRGSISSGNSNQKAPSRTNSGQFQDGGNALNDLDLSLAGTGEGSLGYHQSQHNANSGYQTQSANGAGYNDRPFKSIARDLQSNRGLNNDRQAKSEKRFENQGVNYLPPTDSSYDNQRADNRQVQSRRNQDQNNYQSNDYDRSTFENPNYDLHNRNDFNDRNNENNRSNQNKQKPEYLPPRKEEDSIPRGFSFNHGSESNTKSYYEPNQGLNDNRNDRNNFGVKNQYLEPKRNGDRQRTIIEINRSTELTNFPIDSNNCYDKDGKCGLDDGNFGEKYPLKPGPSYLGPQSSDNDRNQLGTANKFETSSEQGYKFEEPKLDQPQSSPLSPYEPASNDLLNKQQPPKPEYLPFNDYSSYSDKFNAPQGTNQYQNSYQTSAISTNYNSPGRSYLIPDFHDSFLNNLPRLDDLSTNRQYLAPNDVHDKGVASERPPYPPLTERPEKPYSTSSEGPERPYPTTGSDVPEGPYPATGSDGPERFYPTLSSDRPERPYPTISSDRPERPYPTISSDRAERPYPKIDSHGSERPYPTTDSDKPKRPYSAVDLSRPQGPYPLDFSSSQGPYPIDDLGRPEGSYPTASSDKFEGHHSIIDSNKSDRPYPTLGSNEPGAISDSKDKRPSGGFRDGLGNGFPSVNKELPGSSAVAGSLFPDFATSERPNYQLTGFTANGDQGHTKVVVTPSPTYLPDPSHGSLGKPIISVQITSGSRAPGQITSVSTGFIDTGANLGGSKDNFADQKDFRQGDSDFNAGNEPFDQHQYRFQEGDSRTQYLPPPLSNENSLPNINRHNIFNGNNQGSSDKNNERKSNEEVSNDSSNFKDNKDQYLPPIRGDERALDNGRFIPNIQNRYLPIS
ncbi:1-phosphatidylinositol 3-phosphate 5-kinase-like [Prorops nasuta]|uniref:1-phosphatidylinositol 3-phosphate 5-kinase-like n=1 Tax=Prorops nasuta TaxID=863751 RepID=UPI0034CF5C1A